MVTGLVAILAATVGGLYVFGPRGAGPGGVRLSVAGPAAVTSGDEVTYTVTVENADAALEVADLTLEYPVGFNVTRAEPPADNAAGQSLFRLAPLPAGERTEVRVTGRLLGSVGTAAAIRARLDYEPSNFSSSFRAEASAVTSIAASRIKLAFGVPPSAVSPGQISLAVDLQNVGDVTLNGVELVLELPEGVTLTSSTPPLASGVGEVAYDLGTLDPGSTWLARATADIVGDGGSRRGLAAAVYQRIGGQRVVLDRALAEVEVVQPAAQVSLAVNQSTGTSAFAAAGGEIPLSIAATNVGSTTLRNLNLQLRLFGAAVDWARFDPRGGQLNPSAGVWQTTVGDLEPGAEATFDLALPLDSAAQLGATVVAVATLGSGDYGEDWQVTAGPTTVTVQ